MTYKDIRREIELYEKKENEAFMIYGDNAQTEEKKLLFLKAKNRKDAAIAALFDFCKLYRYNNQEEDKEVKKYFLKTVEDYEKAESKKEKLDLKEEFNYIYGKTLLSVLSLEGKDKLKLIKFSEEKRRQHLLIDKIKRNRRDSKSINSLVKNVTSNYEKYQSDKKSRKQDYFHVGTSKEDKEAYYNLITKEEVMYFLLLGAIKDAISYKKEKFILNKELILGAFKGFNMQNEKEDRFFDEDAYFLSRNGFDTYESTFERVYDLSSEYEEKLVKKLNNKIKKEQ